MANNPYYFGAQNLNDGVNYYLLSKDSESIAPIAQTLYKVGRLEGMKKTGQVTNEHIIQLQVLILGASRSDLETKIDALKLALMQQQQKLQIHLNDSRYYIADCIEAKIPLGTGQVISTIAQLKFVAQIPYAFAPSASVYDTGTQTLTLVSGTIYQFPAQILFAGGGTIFNRPAIRLYARNTVTWTQVQVQQLTDLQYLTIVSNLPATNGDYIDIYTDPYSVNGGKIYKNGNTTVLSQYQGVMPVLEPANTAWQIQVTVSSGTPQAEAVFTYTPRWA